MVNKRASGFTIVELLIVIIVIAILAAITLVAFNGIVTRAVESSMQTDLQTNFTALEQVNQATGNYPADARTINNGRGLAQSGSNQLLYLKLGSNNYCLSVMNAASSTVYSLTNTSGTVKQGGCAASLTATTPAPSGSGGWGLVIDAQGTKYFSTAGNTITSLTAAGVLTTLAGTWGASGYNDATGAAAKFKLDNPNQLAIDLSGNLIVPDGQNCVVRKVTMTGVVTTIAGIAGNCGYTDGAYGTNRLSRPNGAAVDAVGNIYISDTYNQRIRKVAVDGTVSTVARLNSWINSIAYDGTSGNVYVGSTWQNAPDNQLYKVSSTGQVTSNFAGAGGGGGNTDGVGSRAKFNSPSVIVVDPSGNFLVWDGGNNQLKAVTQGGAVFTIAGTGTGTNTDGTGVTATFGGVQAMSLDPSGALWLAMPYSSPQLRKVSL